MKKTILVIEDDANIRELLRIYLEREGYVVAQAGDGASGLAAFEELKPSLVLLDIMLPGMDGFEVLNNIRARDNTPVIMLTARSDTKDRVDGLTKGADDYIVKPFEPLEALARIAAVLRRFDPKRAAHILEFDGMTLDMASFTLTVRGTKVDTPPKEMELLYFLASNPGRVFTRNQLLDHVWGFEYFGDTRTVDVHVKRLREKLEGVSEKWSLKTVWGVGYKFEVQES